MVAAQNSQIIRLLSRGVRLDGVDAAIDYGQEIRSLNSAAQVTGKTSQAARELAKPAPLMRFSSPIEL